MLKMPPTKFQQMLRNKMGPFAVDHLAVLPSSIIAFAIGSVGDTSW